MTLVVQNLSVSHGERAILNDVSFAVEAGEFVAVTGRTGAGKTTLLNVIGGLAPDVGRYSVSGSITVCGVELVGATPTKRAEVRRRHVGYVFQGLNLIPNLTAAENVALPLQLHGTATGQATAMAEQALADVELSDRGGAEPNALSGGEQQRVAVARALVGGRSVLLADEPTAALDSVTAEATLRLLRRRADDGSAVMMVTHDSAQAAWAHRILRLHNGTL